MVESPVQTAPTLPRATARGQTAAARRWARRWLNTTPGKLIALSLLLAAGAIAFGVIALVSERSRAQAAHGARVQTEPLLLQAVFLYTALSDANATATATFLQGGLEPTARRAHYLADLRLASDSLGTLTREAGDTPDTRASLGTIADKLPVYSGLIEAARANNRQGYPVGAAYLRQASALLTGTILARANQLFASEAKRLGSDYGQGTATATLVVLIVTVVLALGLLVAAQVYLARISRRVFNVPMLVATAMLAGLSIWSVAGFLGEQDALGRARADSDAVEVLSASRVLVSRAQSDQSLILANRGSDETDPPDLAVVMRTLAPPGGLLGDVSTVLGSAGTAAHRLHTDFAAYRAETARIAALGAAGQIARASALAASHPAAARLDADLSVQATDAQDRFASAAADSTSWVSGLSVAIPVLAVLGGALAVLGVRQRLEEYR